MSDAAPRRLLVVWTAQEPVVRIHGVGCLSATSKGYAFEYLAEAAAVEYFSPFTSFPELGRRYESSQLFPFFSARVIAKQRDDYVATCRALGVDPEAADPLQLLDRTGGTRKGDRVAVVGEPLVNVDGMTSHAFLVKGLRFALADPEEREAALRGVHNGDRLFAVRDEGNDVNADALKIVRADGLALGWVPDGLIPYVNRVLDNPAGRLQVDRLNGPDQPAHLRLLARVTGRHPVDLPPLPQLRALDEVRRGSAVH